MVRWQCSHGWRARYPVRGVDRQLERSDNPIGSANRGRCRSLHPIEPTKRRRRRLTQPDRVRASRPVSVPPIRSAPPTDDAVARAIRSAPRIDAGVGPRNPIGSAQRHGRRSPQLDRLCEPTPVSIEQPVWVQPPPPALSGQPVWVQAPTPASSEQPVWVQAPMPASLEQPSLDTRSARLSDPRDPEARSKNSREPHPHRSGTSSAPGSTDLLTLSPSVARSHSPFGTSGSGASTGSSASGSPALFGLRKRRIGSSWASAAATSSSPKAKPSTRRA